MNSDDPENVWIFFGELNPAPAAFDRSADGDDAGNAGLSRAPKYVVEIVGEIGVIEMRVSFYQHSVQNSGGRELAEKFVVVANVESARLTRACSPSV